MNKISYLLCILLCLFLAACSKKESPSDVSHSEATTTDAAAEAANNDVAADEKDKASQDFLWGFVREQVEEEATVQGIVDKIKLGGEAGLFYLDAQLGARK